MVAGSAWTPVAYSAYSAYPSASFAYLTRLGQSSFSIALVGSGAAITLRDSSNNGTASFLTWAASFFATASWRLWYVSSSSSATTTGPVIRKIAIPNTESFMAPPT